VNSFPFSKGDGRSVYGRRNSFFTFQKGIFLDGMGKGRFGFFVEEERGWTKALQNMLNY
jgi:hypothetical protein